MSTTPLRIHLLVYSCGVCFWLAVGAAGGYFAGQSQTLGKLLNDKIECSLTVNPITMEKLK